jgi:hypothetical protein
MATTQEFFASGMGNGFPFCLSKIDVSGYDKWTTLGGWNKTSVGTPNHSEIGLNQASKLWWMFNGVTAQGQKFVSGIEDESVTVSVDHENHPNSGTDAGPPFVEYTSTNFVDPKYRICESFVSARANATVSGLSVTYNATDEYYPEDEFSATATIFRLYNGETSNESNFVGYGVGALNSGFSRTAGVIRARYESTDVVLTAALIADYGNEDSAYVDLNGFHFVCGAFTSTLRTLTITNNADISSGFVKVESDTGGSTSYFITISAIDLY